MKKTVLYLIVFICFFVTLLFSGENRLAKISYKGYYDINSLEKILNRYKPKKRHRKNRKFINPIINGKTFRKRIFKGIFIKPKTNNLKVRCAQDGKVIFSGFLKYFGNVVIIRHSNRYTTTYAFLKHVKVSKGDYVNQGEQLGYAYRKHAIYFEIRKRAKCLTSNKYNKYIDNG